ncbi:unnamed protein product [Cladocopium goreaui]|uniref:Uncharacterized protein n=1 Tax=Cladocopium goreaui TaxID=2562237 RepID=A0A9P1C094_9DINO|nr:unnamed protein product [Cladocopium goreaui]
MNDYVNSHQDKSRNAMNKAVEASFQAWVEELRADQAQFTSEKVMLEKEGAKARNKLVRQLEGESTVMPQSRGWIRDQASELGCAPDDHGVVLFLNAPAIGVVSAARNNFILNYITNILTEWPTNSVCFIVHPNRASQQEGRTKPASLIISLCPGRKSGMKKEEDDDDVDMETDLSLPERNLRVRSLTYVFDPESMYGKREGVLPGLVVMSNHPKNFYKQTRGFKTGTVMGIQMLARANMVKPESVSPSKLPHLGRAFTDIQEQKQVAGGTDFLQKTLEAFSVASIKSQILIDMHAYDGCCALSAVEDISAGKSTVCGTLCLDHSGSDMMQRIGNVIYERCRASTLTLPGFPDFGPTIAALRNSSVQERTKSYRVSAQQHDTLMVLEVYAKKWLSTESTKERAQEVIQSHNSEFNPTDKTEAESARVEQPPAKRVKLETVTEQELSCSFGGGEWRDGAEADEVLANAEGRWMSFCATNMTLVLLERKGLPEHLASMDSLETVVTLQSLICDLQDLGEVKLELSHHKMEDTDWVNNKSLVFVLDQPPQPQDPQKKKGKKIKGTVQISAKNFGSWMSVTKLKTAGDTVNIAWRVRFPVFEQILPKLIQNVCLTNMMPKKCICFLRCLRLDASNSNGIKVITPIRPILVLAHQHDLNETTLRLM